MKKKVLSFLLALSFILSSAQSALACTGLIVGKDVSADGNPIIARTEDYSSAYNKTILASPRKTNKPGEFFQDAMDFKYPLASENFKYISLPDGYQDEGDVYEAAGFNEYGVSMTATVTAYANKKALDLDPLVEDGITESSVTSVVLPRAKTAREGIELIAKIIDEKGSAEGNIIFLADQNEIWYMEIYTGHQYIAVKYPDDAFSVVPNRYMLGVVDVEDKENVIMSEKLVSLARDNGFLATVNGKIHMVETYGVEIEDYDRSRLWGGINFLDPDKNIPYTAKSFDLFQKTDKKITLKKVMDFQRYRYEGTEFDANLPKNKNVRAIGTINQEECHIIQIKKDMPKEVSGTMWVAFGNAEHTRYLPINNGLTKVDPAYEVKGNKHDNASAYWTLRGISALSEINRPKYGKNVRGYWSMEEDRLIKKQVEVDKKIKELYKESPAKAIEYIDKVGLEEQKKLFDEATLIYSELMTYFDKDSGKSQKDAFAPTLLKETKEEKVDLQEAIKN